ncbi:hypothetical protein HGM15179_013946 [Zosterops borbonicus]|uniref:Uncharacterized protein n=1 Tax=Zosterops borbonicus TaxID=364589 RepID=A0A8K1G7V1_9PASS|nr:hypothetical protein HGM15179_013946 [Zosterops borbonicus]
MGDFSLPEFNWKHHIGGAALSQMIPEDLDDNFMSILRELTWKDTVLDLLLVNRVDLMSKTETGDILATATMKRLNLKSLLREGKCQQNLNSGHEES